jgi:hypothetical protein
VELLCTLNKSFTLCRCAGALPLRNAERVRNYDYTVTVLVKNGLHFELLSDSRGTTKDIHLITFLEGSEYPQITEVQRVQSKMDS